jgi:hypothetical protein
MILKALLNMSSFYKIDYAKLVVMLLPTWLRKERFIAFVSSMVAPLNSLSYRFTKKRNQDHYKLTHNGQVCYLRKVLNDAFDPTLRRIQIVDGNRYNSMYIYTEAELKPKFLKTIHLRDESVYQNTGVDFLVLLPKQVYEIQKTQIHNSVRFYDVESVVDYYKLASKRYKIQLL